MTCRHPTLAEDLAQLERTDPAVADAAARLDAAVAHALRGVPVTRFRKSTTDRPVQVER